VGWYPRTIIPFKAPRMSDLIIASKTEVELLPAPINPSWIIDSNPVATAAILSRSADGTATTIVWECTEGKFNWHYDFDETVYILEGSVVIESDTFKVTRFGPGDVVYFKKGACAQWHVKEHVRKLAFCRHTQPWLVGTALRIVSKLQRSLNPSRAGGSRSMLAAG
jgi:uncharacterized cupin superfamily protein